MDNQQLMLPGFIPRKAENEIINQRLADGYINATAMCKAAGKEWKHYNALSTTKPFIDELSNAVGLTVPALIKQIGLSESRGNPHLQGTWVHPQIAVHLAQWLSPKFAVMVTQWVMEWTSGDIKQQTYMPYHLRRYFANKPNVPYGYFSMLNEAYVTLIGTLEQLGYIVSDRQVPDISFGLTFCKYLRGLGYDVDSFPEYPHKYEDGRVVMARAYPNELLPICQKFLVEDWLKNRAYNYFKKRDIDALPYLEQMKQLPNLREVMGYIEEKPLSEYNKFLKKALDYKD
ncbi:MAG: KilA-N domain-containing protein [Oscillospiraceae bacterium]|jgi:hypothetical protein|nr:KilA-N domain-containing protein [Oscillospiraceae bacterium]